MHAREGAVDSIFAQCSFRQGLRALNFPWPQAKMRVKRKENDEAAPGQVNRAVS